jgi:hypothetical protein
MPVIFPSFTRITRNQLSRCWLTSMAKADSFHSPKQICKLVTGQKLISNNWTVWSLGFWSCNRVLDRWLRRGNRILSSSVTMIWSLNTITATDYHFPQVLRKTDFSLRQCFWWLQESERICFPVPLIKQLQLVAHCLAIATFLLRLRTNCSSE